VLDKSRPYFPFNDFIVIPWTSSSFSGVNALTFLVCERPVGNPRHRGSSSRYIFKERYGSLRRPSSTLLNGGGAKFNKQKNNYVVFVRNDALG